MRSLFFLLLSGLLFSMQVKTQVIESDSLALVDFYNSTNGDNWYDNTGWLTEPVANWYGIYIEDNNVTEIQLGYNNVVGTIPESIGHLDSLKRLHLYNDSLYGTLPATLWDLTNLEEINLRFSAINDVLPADIQNLTQLIFLQLEGNQFHGPLPPEIGKLEQLQALGIENNNFSSLPVEIGNCINLESLNIRGNGFSGPFPDTLFNLKWLYEIRMTNNNFTGPIPDRIVKWQELTDIDLGDNEFNGPIPDVIGDMQSLTQIHLQGNNLTGNIPESMWTLENLHSIELGRNQLSGGISNDIRNLKNLKKFNVLENEFLGAFPDSILTLPLIKELWLNANYFESFPDLLQLPVLEEVDLSYNSLTFDDLEPFMANSWSLLYYEPQRVVYDYIDTTLSLNDTLLINSVIGGSDNSYQWFFNGTQINGATMPQLEFIALSEDLSGTYRCNVTNSLVPGLTIQRAEVNITVEDNASVPGYRGDLAFLVIPNPANNNVKVSLPGQTNDILKIFIVDIHGKEVLRKDHKGIKDINLDVSQLVDGIYFIRIKEGSKYGVSKLIIKH